MDGKFYKTLDPQAKKIVDSYIDTLTKVGYKPKYTYYISTEICKVLHPDYKAKKCKKCEQVQFEVAQKYYINEKPTKPRICVECAGLNKTAKIFKPRITLQCALERTL